MRSLGDLLGLDAEKIEAKERRRYQKTVGVMLEDGHVVYGRKRYPLPAHATVETAGEMEKRITATRVVLTGVFALALKKKRDNRQLFLTVEGDGWAFVADVSPAAPNLMPMMQEAARNVAAQINAAR